MDGREAESARRHIQRNTLARFLLGHCAVGVTAGLAFCAALLFVDAAGLRTLIFASPDWGVWLFLLVGSMCGTFGSLAMAVAVMGLGDHRDTPDRLDGGPDGAKRDRTSPLP